MLAKGVSFRPVTKEKKIARVSCAKLSLPFSRQGFPGNRSVSPKAPRSRCAATSPLRGCLSAQDPADRGPVSARDQQGPEVENSGVT